MSNSITAKVIDTLSATAIAAACDVAPRTVGKWKQAGHLPHTDMTGETDYSGAIVELSKDSEYPVTRRQLFSDQMDLLKPGIVYKIPADMITPDPDQPREQIDYNKIYRLGENILQEGQESPISFRLNIDGRGKDGEPLILTHGERRLTAIQMTDGIDFVLGLLDTKEDGPAARILRQASDNEQREDLTAWDWACTFRKLNDMGIGPGKIANELAGRSIEGFSRSVISNYLRMFKMDERLQELVKSGWLPPGHTKYILGIKSDPVREAIAEDLVVVSKSDDPECPTTAELQTNILEAYRSFHHGLGTRGMGGYHIDVYNTFDHEEECDGCSHKINVNFQGENYYFCGLKSCWDSKYAAYQNQEDEEGGDHEETPEERRERLEQEEEWDRRRRISDAKRKHREAYSDQIKEAVTKDPDAQLAMIYLLETNYGDIPHPDDFSDNEDDTRAILARFKQDRDAMLKVLVDKCMDNLYEQDIDALAYMIEAEPYHEPSDEDVSQETDEQIDAFKEAS